MRSSYSRLRMLFTLDRSGSNNPEKCHKQIAAYLIDKRLLSLLGGGMLIMPGRAIFQGCDARRSWSCRCNSCWGVNRQWRWKIWYLVFGIHGWGSDNFTKCTWMKKIQLNVTGNWIEIGISDKWHFSKYAVDILWVAYNMICSDIDFADNQRIDTILHSNISFLYMRASTWQDKKAMKWGGQRNDFLTVWQETVLHRFEISVLC